MRQKLFALGMFSVVLLFIVATVSVPAAQSLLTSGTNDLPFGLSDVRGLVYGISLVAGIVVLFIALCATYALVPSGRMPWRCVWPGAVGATLAIGVLDYVFPLYLHNVSTLRAGTTFVFVLIALVWFYALAIIVLARSGGQRAALRAPPLGCLAVSAIETVGLTKRYGSVTAVDDLSFSVRDGAVTGFLGPNGAGKTTTLRMILALARPSAGHATVLGRPYAELDEPARTVGANLEIAGAHPGRSGRDHLRALAAMAGLPPTRVDEVLRLVELDDAANRRAGKYSLGMRQRLGLAATLLGDPRVLILDEPANGLDPQGIRWLRDFLRGMAAEGRTVLVSSHVLAEVAQTVDDVVVIHRGRLVDQGPVSRLTAGGRVLVRTPKPEELRAALEQDGLTRERRRAGAAGRRRRPRAGRRHRVHRGRAAARADHAHDLARGGVPRAHDRRGPAP